MKNITAADEKIIVEGIVKAIKANKQENAAKRKVDKNGNLLKGCFAMKTKVYPYLQSIYGMDKEASYKAVDDMASKSGAFKIGKSKYGGIFYLPEDFRAYEGKEKKEKQGFEQFLK